MNRLAVLLVLSLSFPLAARADDASLHAKAQEIVDILHTDKMIGQVADNIRKQVAQAAETVTGTSPTPEAKTKLDSFEKKVSGMVDSELSWTALKPEFVDIYAKTFTEDELNGILAFYKSPAGQAFLTKSPSIGPQVSQITQPRLQALQTQVRQAFEEFRQSQPPAASPAAPSATPGTQSTPRTPPSLSDTPKK